MTDIRGDAADGGLAPDVQVGDVGGGGDTDPSDTGGDGAAVACTSAEALTAAESAAYFPFRVGARWTFRSAGRTNSAPTGPRLDYYAANGTKMIAGATAVAVTGPQQPLYPPQLPTVDEYYEVTAEGLVFRGSSLPPDKVIQGASRVYAAPFTAIPFPIRACTYMPYDVSGIDLGKDQDGDGKNETITARATTTLSFEDVTVPVGQFTRALRVETTEELIVVYSRPDYPSSPSTRYSVDWYASGVGWIKRTAGRESPTTTSELIAYAVGDNRRGLVPSGWLARDLDSASSRHRPAIGYDGTRFLVVSPTAKRTGPVFTTGNLQAIVVDRDGTPVVSRALLDTRDRYGGVSIAWDGTRYLVAYHNGDYRRLELLTVSRNGETIEGPILFEETLSLASTVATKTGFLVAYTKSMPDPGGGFRGISHAWIATVDGQGHATSRVEILPGSEERTPVLAVDGDGRALMLFHAPAAALSQPGPNDVLAAVFIGGDGRVTGSGPFVVAAAPGAIHTETNLLFDGTNFVASWLQQDGLSSATKLHVARISPAGALLDGAATGGGLTVGGGQRPRMARFGPGSLIVWERRSVTDSYAQGIAGTRFIDGKLLDLAGPDGEAWLTSNFGSGPESMPEILWGGDRALVAWTTPVTQEAPDLASVAGGLAYPW